MGFQISSPLRKKQPSAGGSLPLAARWMKRGLFPGALTLLSACSSFTHDTTPKHPASATLLAGINPTKIQQKVKDYESFTEVRAATPWERALPDKAISEPISLIFRLGDGGGLFGPFFGILLSPYTIVKGLFSDGKELFCGEADNQTYLIPSGLPNNTRLHEACRMGDIEATRIFLALGDPVGQQSRQNGISALQLAVEGDHFDTVRVLLAHGSPKFRPPFRLACRQKQFEMFKVLCENGYASKDTSPPPPPGTDYTLNENAFLDLGSHKRFEDRIEHFRFLIETLGCRPTQRVIAEIGAQEFLQKHFPQVFDQG